MKRNRYYIGSHHGSTEDGYICSSTWMTAVYKKRPEKCRRRIISYNTDLSSSRVQTLLLEQAWLDLIPRDQFANKYMNIKPYAIGGGMLLGSKMTDQQRLNNSLSKRGDKNPMYGTNAYETGCIVGLQKGWKSGNGVAQRGATELELYKAARGRSKGWYLTSHASFFSAITAGEFYGVSNVSVINWCQKGKKVRKPLPQAGWGYKPKD